MVYNMFINILSICSLCIRIIGVLGILFFYSKIAVCIILIVSFPLFIIAIKSGESIYTVTKEVSIKKRKSDYLGLVLTNRDFVDERTLFSYGKELSDRWIKVYENVRKIKYKTKFKWYIKSKIGSMLVSIISILVLFVFLIFLAKGEITIGLFISLGYGVMNLVEYMSWSLVELIQNLAKDKEYFHDLKNFFSFDEEECIMELPCKNIILKTLEFKNVSFKYPGTNKYAIKNLSFRIQADKHYAIVGNNGSGKTTITKLIVGLYDEFDGEILINDINIKKYKKCEIKGLTSIVYQDFAKYPISIKENIAIGNIENMNIEKKIKQVINYLKLDEFKDCLDQELGKLTKSSIDLSGGQWQKIAMARTLISDSSIMILDEPTAAVDPISECKIYENFDLISRDKTTIFISHRLGSIKLADEILVLKDGILIGIGTHKELMKKCEYYNKMYNNQKDWYLC